MVWPVSCRSIGLSDESTGCCDWTSLIPIVGGIRFECHWSDAGPELFHCNPIPILPESDRQSITGRGAAWLARLLGVQEVVGSNPAVPT